MRVGGVGEGGGAVVDVEEDGVEFCARCAFGAEQGGDVGDFDADALVGERVGGEMYERAAIPVDNFGDEFGDDYVGARGEKIERGAEGVAHAEAADQDRWVMRGGLIFCGALRGSGDAAASEGGEGFFGGVGAARHEMAAAGEDYVFVVAALELDDGAVGRVGVGEEFEGLHRDE